MQRLELHMDPKSCVLDNSCTQITEKELIPGGQGSDSILDGGSKTEVHQGGT